MVLRGEENRNLPSCSLCTHLGEAPERDLAHSAPDAGLDDEGPDAGVMHLHPKMSQSLVPEGVFLRIRLRGGDGVHGESGMVVSTCDDRPHHSRKKISPGAKLFFETLSPIGGSPLSRRPVAVRIVPLQRADWAFQPPKNQFGTLQRYLPQRRYLRGRPSYSIPGSRLRSAFRCLHKASLKLQVLKPGTGLASADMAFRARTIQREKASRSACKYMLGV